MAFGAPIQITGCWKIRIAKAADRNAEHRRQRFQPGEDVDATGWAEVGFVPATGFRRAPPAFELAADFDGGFRKKRGIGKRAAGAALTFQAGAGVNELRRRRYRDRQPAAGTGGGFRIGGRVVLGHPPNVSEKLDLSSM